jgi:hypothetical protein
MLVSHNLKFSHSHPRPPAHPQVFPLIQEDDDDDEDDLLKQKSPGSWGDGAAKLVRSSHFPQANDA